MNTAIPQSSLSVLSAADRVSAGHWKLQAGRALSLHPRERGVLEIALGRAWVTVAGAHCASADHVLAAGERLVVEPGHHVVIEPWAGSGWSAVAFRWDAAPVATAVAAPAPTDWERGVAQPARELAQALAGVGRAAARVVAGFVAWAGRVPRALALPGGRGGAPCGG